MGLVQVMHPRSKIPLLDFRGLSLLLIHLLDSSTLKKKKKIVFILNPASDTRRNPLCKKAKHFYSIILLVAPAPARSFPRSGNRFGVLLSEKVKPSRKKKHTDCQALCQARNPQACKPHNSRGRQVLSLSSFYPREDRGSERLHDWPEATQHGR